MLNTPKPYKLCPTQKTATGGGYITDLNGALLTNYQNEEVRLKKSYSHGSDYIYLINNIAKIPAFLDLHTVVATLRNYTGRCEELVLDEMGMYESVESFDSMLYKKGLQIIEAYENSSDNDPI